MKEEKETIEQKFLTARVSTQLRILFLGLGTILVWRGVWTLNDELIVPDDPVLSSSISIFLGLLVFVILSEIRL